MSFIDERHWRPAESNANWNILRCLSSVTDGYKTVNSMSGSFKRSARPETCAIVKVEEEICRSWKTNCKRKLWVEQEILCELVRERKEKKLTKP